MRVFLYEWTCAQPLDADLPPSLRSEGAAMWKALWLDFRALPGFEVRTFLGEGWPEALEIDQSRQFQADAAEYRTLSGWAEAALVIAPEFQGILEDLVSSVEQRGRRSLNCTSQAIALAGNKRQLAQHWQRLGIPTPAVLPWPEANSVAEFPLVIKPEEGAGSQHTYLVQSASQIPHQKNSPPMIAQPFVPGMAASMAFLIGPNRRHALLPARQHLSDDGRFRYLGGEIPLPPALVERALMVAEPAVACVPGLRGYVGVDFVLGEAKDGSQDYAIEINPRLTTSYLGLRALSQRNLAEAMLKVVQGEPIALRWREGTVRFRADGTI